MKQLKYPLMALAGFILWLIGTIHGGWSLESQSSFESFTDFVGMVLLWWGIIGDILTNVQIHKVQNITTENVIMKDETKKKK